jgi:hypothetical protein
MMATLSLRCAATPARAGPPPRREQRAGAGAARQAPKVAMREAPAAPEAQGALRPPYRASIAATQRRAAACLRRPR